MDSIRQQKISRLVLKELADIFLRDGKRFFGSALITVTIVRVSPDLSIAKAYLSLFGAKDKDALLRDIHIHTPELKILLHKRLSKQLRVMPDLKFFLDDSLDYIERIDNALKQ